MTRVVVAAFVFLLLGSVRPAAALCMSDGQGPCYRFWKADAVFVAKVVEKVAHAPRPSPSADVVFIDDNYRLRVIVAEAFRGVEAGTTMTLFAPDGVCGGVNARDGEELFIYASRNERGELWAHGCGVSGPIDRAEADLVYARSVNAHGPKAMVCGDVVQREDIYGDARDFSPLGGVRVRVRGQGFEADALTDNEGHYAIELPGAGEFSIVVLPLDGYADRFPGPVEFRIAERRSCFNASFQLQSNGRIRGRVVNANDAPLSGLIMTAGERSALTDATGTFDLGPLSPGVYAIGAATGGQRLEFEHSPLVEIQSGRATTIDPLVAVATDRLVTLTVAVAGGDGRDVHLLLQSKGGSQLGDVVRVNGGAVRFLVEQDREFIIVAESHTHEAKATLRTAAPAAEVTLTLRPSRQQR